MSESSDCADLAAGTNIDHFTIERRLGGGGFGIVYLGREAGTDRPVVIKEYMPRKLARRGEDGLTIETRDEASADKFARGRRLFFQEATILVTLKHPNVVDVINFFRANGTIYMVMAYEEGLNLQEYGKRHKGPMEEKLLRHIFLGVLEGLQFIHGKGYLHLDIKPGNIYLRDSGEPLLLDFGAVHEIQSSRQYQVGHVLTRGYSPVEQTNQNGYIGPWTDIYAVGATMRSCLDHAAPPPSEERYIEDKLKPALEMYRKRYSRNLLHCIDWAMEVDPLHRPQSIEQLLEELNRSDEPEPQRKSMFERLAANLPWGKGSR